MRIAFLKKRRRKPYDSLVASGELEKAAEDASRAVPHAELLSDGDISEIVTKVTSELRNDFERTLARAWPHHIAPFTLRMKFELWLPLVLTVVNLASSIFRLAT